MAAGSVIISRSGFIMKPRFVGYKTWPVTASGDTTLVSGITGYTTMVFYLTWSNSDTSMIGASLKFGDGDAFMTEHLSANGGAYPHNFVGAELITGSGEAVKAALDDSGSVSVTLGYIQFKDDVAV